MISKEAGIRMIYYMLIPVGLLYLLGGIFGIIAMDLVSAAMMVGMAFVYFISDVIIIRVLKEIY